MTKTVSGRLWQCPACKRRFANRNQTHTCGLHTLDHHFEGKPPRARELFDRLVAILEACGPLTVLPEKTRIAFHVRMSFAAVSVRRDYLVGHFVFGRRQDHPRFTRVETFSPRNHLHAFRIESLEDFDQDFERWAREAYAVGEQRHLAEPPITAAAASGRSATRRPARQRRRPIRQA